MKFVVDSTWHGKTVKQYLFGGLGLTRRQVSALKVDPLGILYNGKHVTVRYILTEGDVLEVALADEESEINPEIEAVKLDFDVVYEDEYMLVADKPYNMPVHPSYNHRRDSLANAVAYYYCEKGIIAKFRAVNRLDRDTSGLVVLAKDRMTANRLAVSFAEGRVKKEYVALLEGKLEKNGEIESYIKRERESIITRISCSHGIPSEYALTRYSVLGYDESRNLTVVKASPVTGRTHQLRVHFASIGNWIAGDDLYGSSSPYIERQALHAYSLELVHPHTGSCMRLLSKIPNDIKNALTEEVYVEIEKKI